LRDGVSSRRKEQVLQTVRKGQQFIFLHIKLYSNLNSPL
jgi:hypothetical protein